MLHDLNPSQIIDTLMSLRANQSALNIHLKNNISFKTQTVKKHKEIFIITNKNLVFYFKKNISRYFFKITYNNIVIYRNVNNWYGISLDGQIGWQEVSNLSKIQSIILGTLDIFEKEANRLIDKDLRSLLGEPKNKIAKIPKEKPFQNLVLFTEEQNSNKKILVLCFLVIGSFFAGLQGFPILVLYGTMLTTVYCGKELNKKERLIEDMPLSLKEQEEEFDQLNYELDEQIKLAEG